MSSINKVILLGRLGNDPEIRSTNDDRSLCDFSIATSSRWMDKTTNEWKENVEWHNLVSFDQRVVDFCKTLHKGDLVYVEGSLRTKSINNSDMQNGGKPVQKTQIIINSSAGLKLIHRKQSSTGNTVVEDDLDDIPF